MRRGGVAFTLTLLIDDTIHFAFMASADQPRLALSVLAQKGFEEREASSVDLDQILREMESGEAWEVAVQPIAEFPQFPRMHIDWHRGFGFVVMAFEDEKSIGFYPIVGATCGKPEVPIELGGQALEKWPRELFVPRQIAACDTGRAA